MMGIHYDYKNTRGAKKLQKQHEREQRRLSKKSQQMPEQKPDETKPLTLDMITDLAIPTTCARPYDTLLIDSWGSCFLCECQSWLPQSVGNLHRNSIPEILNSAMAKEMQTSVADGTYRYCNNHQCMYIKKGDIRPVTQGRALQNLRLAIDNSCNLSCPSCR